MSYIIFKLTSKLNGQDILNINLNINMAKKTKELIKKLKLIFLFALIINCHFAQYGKNIVQYDKFEWNFIQTIHFDIYYYSQGELQIDIVANHAEKAYDKISNLIGWDLNYRSSIIVYNSHNDFQQTNVVDSYMQEGIGGVTELLKNRMVIPFDISTWVWFVCFDWVLGPTRRQRPQ